MLKAVPATLLVVGAVNVNDGWALVTTVVVAWALEAPAAR